MEFLPLREPINAVSHGLWLLLALPATILLWQRSRGDPLKRVCLLVYGLSLMFCFAASAIYHGVVVPMSRLGAYDRVDHIGIFVLIAGSYTPLAWTLLRGRWRWGTLALAWLLTAAAAAFLWFVGLFPPTVATGVYMLMGWSVVLCYFEIARVLSHRALLPLVVGGVIYTVGAVLNLLHWPVLWPGVFGSHETFHVLVMAGSLIHFWFMLYVIAPFVG